MGHGQIGGSVKPATQFLQQSLRPLAQGGVARIALDVEKSLEGGNGGAALVEPRIELPGFEQQLRPPSGAIASMRSSD